MKLLSPSQVNNIITNINKVMISGNINLLSKQSYNYLYLCSGFIAHYNYHGFIAHYYNVNELILDIKNNKQYNQWLNFRKNDENYAYYMQKRDIYNRLCVPF